MLSSWFFHEMQPDAQILHLPFSPLFYSLFAFSPFRPQLFRHLPDDLLKVLALGGGNPLQAQARRVDALLGQFGHEFFDAGLGPQVPGHVMTVPRRVAAGDQHLAGAPGEGMADELGMDPPGAHDPDDPHRRGVLQPGNPGEIRPGIGAPVAAEGQNLLLAIGRQGRINLGQDHLVGKAPGDDGSAGAGPGADPAPFAGRFDNPGLTGFPFSHHFHCLERALLVTAFAPDAQLLVHLANQAVQGDGVGCGPGAGGPSVPGPASRP
jgi:hypothetical protein